MGKIADILELMRAANRDPARSQLIAGQFDVRNGKRDLPIGVLRRRLIGLSRRLKHQTRFVR